MKRLFQAATVVLVLTGFIAPLLEFFDRWDTEGLSNDTEFGVFALIFLLCLALLVWKLISSVALAIFLVSFSLFRDEGNEKPGSGALFPSIVPPIFNPPLRI